LAALRARPTAAPVPEPAQQPGYNRLLHRLPDMLRWLIGALARDTNTWTDDV
jgi:hypothetical protein